MNNRNDYDANSQRYRWKTACSGLLLLELLLAFFIMATVAVIIARYQVNIKQSQCEALNRLQVLQELESWLERELGGERQQGCKRAVADVDFVLESGDLFASVPVCVVTAQKMYNSQGHQRMSTITTVLPERVRGQ